MLGDQNNLSLTISNSSCILLNLLSHQTREANLIRSCVNGQARKCPEICWAHSQLNIASDSLILRLRQGGLFISNFREAGRRTRASSVNLVTGSTSLVCVLGRCSASATYPSLQWCRVIAPSSSSSLEHRAKGKSAWQCRPFAWTVGTAPLFHYVLLKPPLFHYVLLERLRERAGLFGVPQPLQYTCCRSSLTLVMWLAWPGK